VKRILLLSSFVFGNLSILVISLLFLSVFTTRGSAAVSLPAVPAELPEANFSISGSTPTGTGVITGTVTLGDARARIIDQFFRRYHSPMEGLGEEIVAAADRNKLPYGLLPAIGQCEGNAGKVMPEGSFNTWGYGIYGSSVKRFKSWQDAIQAVSADLRANYFNRGLDTPAEIMTRYAPSSNGSWANCVDSYLLELR
jgi:hypothetical protein